MRTLFFTILLPAVLAVPEKLVAKKIEDGTNMDHDEPDTSYTLDINESEDSNISILSKINTTETTCNILIRNNVCIPGLSECTLASQKREDYHYVTGVGAYKMHTRSTTFNEARKICIEEGGNLAVIETAAEELVLLDLFKKHEKYVKQALDPNEALIGIHDLYAEGDWVTIFGDSIYKHEYTKWVLEDKWGGQPDNLGGRQNCGALVKTGGMDDVDCFHRFPFFCELPKSPCGF